MTNRVIYHLVACVVCTFLVWANEQFNTTDLRLHFYANRVSNHLQVQEQFCEKTLKDVASSVHLMREMTGDTAVGFREDLIKRCAELDVSFVLYRNARQIFWTNNTVLPLEEHYSLTTESSFDSLSSGFFELLHRPILSAGKDTLVAIMLIPIKHRYNLYGSSYLKDYFSAGSLIPSGIKITEEVDKHAIVKRDGKTLCYLSSSTSFVDDNLDWLTFIFFLLFALAWGMLLQHGASFLSERYNVWIGSAFLLLLLVLSRWLSLKFHVLDRISQLLVFKPLLSGESMISSIGDFAIIAVFFLWFIVFLVSRLNEFNYNRLPQNVRVFLVFVFNICMLCNYIVVLLSLRGAALLAHEGAFDLVGVLPFDIRLYVLLLGVVMLMIGLYLSSRLYGHQISILGLSKTQARIALLFTLLFFIPIAWWLDLPLGFEFNVLFMILLLMPELYPINKNSPVVYALGLLVFFSLVTAGVLVTSTNKFDLDTRANYAEELAKPEDLQAKSEIDRLVWKIQQDKNIQQYFDSPLLKIVGVLDLENDIKRIYSTDPYLYQHYRLRFRIIDKDKGIVGGDTAIGSELWRDISIEDTSKTLTESGQNIYLVKFSMRDTSENKQSSNLDLQCFLTRKQREYTRVYNELTNSLPFKGLTHLQKYKYAITYNGKITESNCDDIREDLSPTISTKLGASQFTVDNEKTYNAFQNEDKKMAFVWQQDNAFDTIVRVLRLSSVIFFVLFGVVCLLMFINAYKTILPEYMLYKLSVHWPLIWVFQVAIMFMGFVTLFITGLVTIMIIKSPLDKIQNDRIGTHLRDLNNQDFVGLLQNIDTDQTALPTLKKSLENWSNIHQIDINLFATTGELIASSDSAFFQRGIITKRINPIVLNSKTDKTRIIAEKIGTLEYQAAYKIAFQKDTNVILGYYQLPYYSSSREQIEQYSNLFVTLLTVYIFLLLLLSGIFTTWLANYVVKPISLIAKQIKTYRLYGRYEVIEVKRQDEFGEILDEYNKLIQQLNERTTELVKTQREEAWRDMARQVAHEIRNPLTPMKLSIQYLQQFYSRENGEEVVRRVCKTLLEQIETLSRVTTEFLHFGRMPTANSETVILNEVLTSVFELFREHTEIQFDHDITEEKLYIFADRNQLVIALNNLVKNAIQAIPNNRSGRIVITLVKHERNALIAIKDNGTGIPLETQNKVFDASFTTKATGTGLGLSITSNIIRSLNGEIRFESIDDKGTTFL